MTPERWQQLKELLAPALEKGPAERITYLEEVSAREPQLRAELELLLAAEEEAGTTFLRDPAPIHRLEDLDFEQEPDGLPAGQRIGGYQLCELIGEGGMGTVYRAVRVSDFQKVVAIKLVKQGIDTEFILQRFRHERQILARLDHPNIARLFDGGATEGGRPYLVMEYIDGIAIDKYCDTHQLKVSERLHLFRQVCAAVQCAHQHLIIHRDIKPSNILVTSEGVPKLLDFGIAKILDPTVVDGPIERTRTVFRALTVGYASPEQVMEGAITTASDVYSLGVVLYELLTGCSPYCLASRTVQEIARAVCEVEPEKPSAAVCRTPPEEAGSDSQVINPAEVAAARQSSADRLKKRLAGDLDNIVLMALRKEPRRRYGSVEEFSRDIAHHLESLPVIAGNDTLGYRASKFFRRNKTAVAAVTAVILTLLLGLAVTLRMARVARAQQQRAEHHFNEIRELSNSLMFDIHDAIQNLPGATPVRKMLVDRSLKYLNSLASESGVDASLRRELAAAYERVATVQGNPFGSNLGDLEGAAANYRKAAAIWESLLKTDSNSIQDLLGLAGVYRQLAGTVANVGSGDPFELIQKTLAASQPMAGLASEDPRIAEELELDHEMAAAVQVKTGGDPSAALENHRKALAFAVQRLKMNSQDRLLERRVANIRMRMGESLAELGRQNEALEEFHLGLEIFEADPDYTQLYRDVARLLWKWGDVLMMGGETRAALQRYRRAQAFLESLSRSDPQNVQVRVELASTSARVGWALSWARDEQASLSMFEQAVRIFEPMVRNPQFVEAHSSLALTHIWRGEFLARTGNRSKALEDYQQGVAEFGAVMGLLPWDRFWHSSLAASHSKAGIILAGMGRDSDAAAEYQRALEMARPLATTRPDTLPWYTVAEACFGMGELSRVSAQRAADGQKQLQHWNEARAWYQQSLEAWRHIPNPSVISSAGFTVGDLRQAVRALALVDVEVVRLSKRPR